MIFRRDTHAVVFDKEDGFGILLAALTDLDKRVCLTAHVFGGVLDQVLQDLCQALAVSMDGGQVRLSLNRCLSGFDLPVDDLQRILYQRLKLNILRRVHHAPDT